MDGRRWAIVFEDEYRRDDAYCNGVGRVRKTFRSWMDPIRGSTTRYDDFGRNEDETIRERRHGTIRGQIRTTSKRG